jgi:hypothetical protein
VTAGTDWAEQARRLVETLRGVLGTLAAHDDRAADGGTGTGTGTGTECRWCPLCQMLAVLRGERPEVTAVIADVLRATADSLHAFAAAPDAPRPEAPADEQPAPPVADPPPVVQRIEIA